MRFEKAIAAGIALSVLLWVVPIQAQTQTAATNADPDIRTEQPVRSAENLDTLIEEWIAVIADEEERPDWRDVRWDKHTLGPGTHGWVVLLKDKQKGMPVGYLVIHASEDGTWQLTEYGFGEYPLFGEATLYDALLREEIISKTVTFEHFYTLLDSIATRTYDTPLQAYWTIELRGSSYIIDAKTGESYIIEKSNAQLPEFSNPAPMIPAQLRLKADTEFTDPFDHVFWLSHSNKNITFAQVAEAVSEGRNVVFTGKIFADEVTIPLAVTGIRAWSSGSKAVTVEQYGPRLIAFESLSGTGTFHISPMSGSHDLPGY